MRYLVTALVISVFSLVSSQSVMGQQANNDNTGNVSGQTGQSDRFTIQRDNTGFIGGSATSILNGQAATAGRTGGLGTAGLIGGLSGLGGGFGNRGAGNTGFGNQANSQSSGPQIRFRITLGFTHPRPSASAVSVGFARRLTRLPQLPSAKLVSVTMEERTAVLSGEVDSEREKRLIAHLARMEPGVSEVRNDLTVKRTPELLPLTEPTN
jgi:BON domain